MNTTPANAPQSRYRVLVTGSRTWTDPAAITQALDHLLAAHGERLTVVHGACPRGADQIADSWARAHHVQVEAHPADWTTGRAAGPTRNRAMVDTHPDECLAFIADASRGATGCADLAERAGIRTHRTTPDPLDRASAPVAASLAGLIGRYTPKEISVMSNPYEQPIGPLSEVEDQILEGFYRRGDDHFGERVVLDDLEQRLMAAEETVTVEEFLEANGYWPDVADNADDDADSC